MELVPAAGLALPSPSPGRRSSLRAQELTCTSVLEVLNGDGYCAPGTELGTLEREADSGQCLLTAAVIFRDRASSPTLATASIRALLTDQSTYQGITEFGLYWVSLVKSATHRRGSQFWSGTH